MLFVGDDWAEDHHDVELVEESGRRLVRRRLPEGVAGIAALHALVSDHLPEEEGPEAVVVGIETDHGPWVLALMAAGYQVFAINPLQAARYRERHGVGGAKSDRGDAHVLAEIVRQDRAHHRRLAGDTAAADAVRSLARAHQNLIWTRQRQANQLRATLREYYPAALAAFTEVADRDALAVLAAAPSPEQGRALNQDEIVALLRGGGRQRYLGTTAARVHAALQTEQLPVPAVLATAHGAAVTALVAVLQVLATQIAGLQQEVETHFGRHPDAEIYRSLPGMGTVLGARVLAEFGDDPDRFATPKARKNYSGTSPITRQSGRTRLVLARHIRNKRLADALFHLAFSAIRHSPGAHAYYTTLRERGIGHNDALRRVANRLVGILHGCLHHRQTYNETHAWPTNEQQQPAA